MNVPEACNYLTTDVTGSTGTSLLASAMGGYAAAAPRYLDVDAEALRARLLRLPVRAEIPVICAERLVVEFYSR